MSLALQTALTDPDSAEALYYQAQGEFLKRSLRDFTYAAWPELEGGELKGNWHIDMLADSLQAWVMGEIPWLMINMPPRNLKSVMCSIMMPAWAWINFPRWHFLYASYAQNLSLRDARNTKRLIQSEWFQKRFGQHIRISKDATQVSDFYTMQGGRRISATARSKTTGEGAHALVVDDLHNVKDVESDTTRRSTLSWHDDAFWNRYMDPKEVRRLYVGQRTHAADVYGHVRQKHGDRFEYIEIPMEMRPDKKKILTTKRDNNVVHLFDDPRTEDGELLHPERMGDKELDADKSSLSEAQYQAQYQQAPAGEEGLIIKRKWWHEWCYPEGHAQEGIRRPLPEVEEIFQVYDTAFEEGEENDCSARTTWGLFSNNDPGMNGGYCLILLDRFNKQVGFPDLVDEALRANEQFGPDRILIEKRASGHSLKQVLRKKKLPATGVKIKGGKNALDKVARAHYVSVAFEQNMVFYVPRNWTYEVIDQVCGFPQVDHDDLADTVFMAVAYCLNRRKLQFSGQGNSDVDLFISKTVSVPGYGSR